MEERQEGDWLSDYMVYLRIFGKVISGNKLEDKDFGEEGEGGWKPYDQWKKLAVALAAADARDKSPGLVSLADYKKTASQLMQAGEAKRPRGR